jgi:hypothetical protein
MTTIVLVCKGHRLPPPIEARLVLLMPRHTQDDIVATQCDHGQIHGLEVRIDADLGSTQGAARLFGTTIIALDGVARARDGEPVLLDESRRNEVAGSAAVQKDYDGVTADETSQLDESTRGSKLVDLRDNPGAGDGARWRCGGGRRGRLLFMPEAARQSGNLMVVGWHR